MYTLDTNAVIYYAQGDTRAVEALDRIFSKHAPLYISTVSEIELFGFPSLAEEEAQRIEQFLSVIAILPLDSHIARLAASLRRQFRIKTLDSAIAATALITHSSLITRNLGDFKKIPNLEVVRI